MLSRNAPRDNGFTQWLLYDIPPAFSRIRGKIFLPPKRPQSTIPGLQGANQNDAGKSAHRTMSGFRGRSPATPRGFALRPSNGPFRPALQAMGSENGFCKGKGYRNKTEMMGLLAKEQTVSSFSYIQRRGRLGKHYGVGG